MTIVWLSSILIWQYWSPWTYYSIFHSSCHYFIIIPKSQGKDFLFAKVMCACLVFSIAPMSKWHQNIRWKAILRFNYKNWYSNVLYKPISLNREYSSFYQEIFQQYYGGKLILFSLQTNKSPATFAHILVLLALVNRLVDIGKFTHSQHIFFFKRRHFVGCTF